MEKIMRRAGGWAVAVGVAAALFTTTALAGEAGRLPPLEYDIGGKNEAETLRNLYGRYGRIVDLIKVPLDQVYAECDAVHQAYYHREYPTTRTGERILGCYVPHFPGTRATIVYPVDPTRPELAHRVLLHEIGHLKGWGHDHPPGTTREEPGLIEGLFKGKRG